MTILAGQPWGFDCNDTTDRYKTVFWDFLLFFVCLFVCLFTCLLPVYLLFISCLFPVYLLVAISDPLVFIRFRVDHFWTYCFFFLSWSYVISGLTGVNLWVVRQCNLSMEQKLLNIKYFRETHFDRAAIINQNYIDSTLPAFIYLSAALSQSGFHFNQLVFILQRKIFQNVYTGEKNIYGTLDVSTLSKSNGSLRHCCIIEWSES